MVCTEKSFLKDVAGHQMTVLRDDGLNRHIRFKAPGTMMEHFDLITWPGYLCYTGDMGTYVFRRLQDMFAFFRADREHMRLPDGLTLAINPGYWGEKLESIDRCGEFEQFSMDRFKAAVKEDFDALTEDNEDWTDDERTALWADIEACVLSCEDEYEAAMAVREFHHAGCEDLFSDFFEHNLNDYTYRFIWCCYALAWGIRMYDAAHDAAGASEKIALDAPV